MRLTAPFARKLAVLGIAATGLAMVAAAPPAAAQYYNACAPGSYLAPGYGCVPYAYAPGYVYPPDLSFGYVGVWPQGGGWHGGWDHGGRDHGGGHGR
jgi:hypothetical protein